MRGKTHIIGGAAAGAAVSAFLVFPFGQTLALAATAALGGLIPDLDQSSSTISKKTGPIGWLISRNFSHRGVLHTPIVYLLLNAALYAAIHNSTVRFCLFGLLIGELSHLLLDTLNRIGIMWLWPFSKKRFHFLSVHSGGKADELIFGVCSLLTLAFILVEWI